VLAAQAFDFKVLVVRHIDLLCLRDQPGAGGWWPVAI
jgi:hypothetical protein